MRVSASTVCLIVVARRVSLSIHGRGNGVLRACVTDWTDASDADVCRSMSVHCAIRGTNWAKKGRGHDCSIPRAAGASECGSCEAWLMPMRKVEEPFVRDASMGVGPITSIRAVSLLNHGKEESCVPPPFAVDHCERGGDDTYDSGGSQLDRGREGEEDQAVPKLEGSVEEEGSEAVDPDASVNLFA